MTVKQAAVNSSSYIQLHKTHMKLKNGNENMQGSVVRYHLADSCCNCRRYATVTQR